jgi:hypothetical protein
VRNVAHHLKRGVGELFREVREAVGEPEAQPFLVALGVFFPVYANTLHGIRSVDPQLIEMGRVYGDRCGMLRTI